MSSPRRTRRLAATLALLPVVGLLTACGEDEQPADLVVYSGRAESLVSGILADFEKQSGLEVEVRYGDTAEMAAQLLEEGDKTPADVFFSQDAGALGSLSAAGVLKELPAETLAAVPTTYVSSRGDWVGVTGRVRVLAYDPAKVEESELPDDVTALTDPAWRGRVAIAPTNASFQAFVTALRVSQGEQAAEDFLRGLVANDVQIYDNNLTMLDALEAGQVDVGLTNHYYLHELTQEVGADKVRTKLKFLPPGTAGALVNVTGVGVLASTGAGDAAAQLTSYLLDPETQATFVDETGEYPLVTGVTGPDGLPTLDELGAGAGIDLGQLESLDETVALLAKVGLV